MTGHEPVADAAAAPSDPLDQAKRLIRAARFDAAEAVLTRLLEADSPAPQLAEARYALAVAQRYAGRLDAALATIDELLATRPGHARAHQERGHCLLALNDPETARSAFGEAVRLNPGLLASWKALTGLHRVAGDDEAARFAKAQAEYLQELPAPLRNAHDLLHEGKLYKAERLCRDFLQGAPQHVEGMRLLAQVATRLRIYDDAEFLLESCVEFAPDHVGARADYLRILHRRARYDVALEQARILVRMQPGNPAFELAVGNALAGLGRLEEAVEIYDRCLPASPNPAGIEVMRGHALKALGRLDAAVEAYRRAAELRPDYGDAFWSLANTKTYRFDDGEIDQMRRAGSDPATGEDDRVHLCFALGKAYEDRGDFPVSSGFYAQGNEQKLASSGYDADRTDALVREQVEACTAELFERRGHLGNEAADPIFVVGLPRAGSTLIEQILASHPQVDGTMELHDVLGLAQRLRRRRSDGQTRYPANLHDIDPALFSRFGQQYLDRTRVHRGQAPFFVDKMPNNFLHVGLIRLILPNAKVIDARRHPLACGVSCFRQLFGEGQDFSYGLGAIGRYYRAYVELMDHWDRVLPGFVLRVHHEDVVEDLETAVRRMLAFCGLPFDAKCLRFHESTRSVRTPSSEQVRQPIFRGGMEHWRNFDAWLDPLREALGDEVRARYALEDCTADRERL